MKSLEENFAPQEISKENTDQSERIEKEIQFYRDRNIENESKINDLKTQLEKSKRTIKFISHDNCELKKQVKTLEKTIKVAEKPDMRNLSFSHHNDAHTKEFEELQDDISMKNGIIENLRKAYQKEFLDYRNLTKVQIAKLEKDVENKKTQIDKLLSLKAHHEVAHHEVIRELQNQLKSMEKLIDEDCNKNRDYITELDARFVEELNNYKMEISRLQDIISTHQEGVKKQELGSVYFSFVVFSFPSLSAFMTNLMFKLGLGHDKDAEDIKFLPNLKNVARAPIILLGI